ncbi:hypothetical protein [Leptolyngbya sp. PCC 6406]|uniref:hypothetical protein n=1 Tax=Leptolyngbya sp. PCC 6406 TaxID=1173264 RepID=UPI0002ABB998|nr:hypothetical protein [Leptolyngbya sp. PCC 6406]
MNEVNIPLDSYVECKSNSKQEAKYQLAGELEELRQARNNIEHKEASLDKDAVNKFLGVAFRFLDDFVSLELGLSLSEKLEELDELRKEAVVLPDPRSYSTIIYCYNCCAKYEGCQCAKCEQTYIEYLGEWEKGDNPPEHPDLESLLNSEEADVSFCEVCQDWIADQ